MTHQAVMTTILLVLFQMNAAGDDTAKELLKQAELQAKKAAEGKGSLNLPMDDGPFTSDWIGAGWREYRLP
jgi:hypothetical protein